MTSRGKIPSSGARYKQVPGMMRHGPFPGLGPGSGRRPMEPLPPPELMEHKIAAQVAEIESLTRENQRVAATHVALRQDLIATQQEMQRIQAHIGSIQTESDIQIRMLLEKIKKMEADIRAGESMKMDLQQAHKEAQSLLTTRHELASEIQQATQELQKARIELEQLPDLHAEVNKLRQEHHRLRAAFEYEKGLNIEQVEKLRAREKNLISMSREVDKLRAEVLNAEKRAHAPHQYGLPYSNPDSSYPAPMQGGSGYLDNYGRHQVQMGGGVGVNGINPYGSTGGALNDGGGSAIIGSDGNANGTVAGSGAWRGL